MIRIVKEFSWAMAHRLTCGYQGKCRNLHGHTYKCAVELEASRLDSFGMVVDFSWIKEILTGWVNSNLDHAVLATAHDNELLVTLDNLGTAVARMPERYTNTTAEQIADMLFGRFNKLVQEHDAIESEPRVIANVRLISVTVWETETAKAVWSTDHGA